MHAVRANLTVDQTKHLLLADTQCERSLSVCVCVNRDRAEHPLSPCTNTHIHNATEMQIYACFDIFMMQQRPTHRPVVSVPLLR